MKLIKNRVSSVLFFLTLFLVFTNSVSCAQKNVKLDLETQGKSSIKKESLVNTDNVKGFIQLHQADGSDRLVPLITGGIFSTIILTAMYGAVLLLIVTLVLGYFASKNTEKDNKNQYLSEALPNAIEGITIIYIVIVVLLFGILGITSAEGSLSILSAISGYVLGKSQGKRSSGEISSTSNSRKDNTVSERGIDQD